MSLPPLTLIPAGAGSGKTHSIQEKLGEWVAAGKVAPERIVAVTFTEAAAAELKERIGSKLLAMGRVEDALRLDQAYISTIHGFGLRILTEFAFESGTSPQPRLLNEDEQNALIRLAAARTEQANEIASNLAAYGYVFVFGAEKTPEDMFREDLLKIVELLRSVGWRSHSDDYAAQAAAFIAERYGPVGDGAQLSAALRQSVETLLRQFPDSLSSQYGSSKTAADALQKDFGNLSAARKRNAIESDWKLWQSSGSCDSRCGAPRCLRPTTTCRRMSCRPPMRCRPIPGRSRTRSDTSGRCSPPGRKCWCTTRRPSGRRDSSTTAT